MKEDIYPINQKNESRDLIRFYICGTTYPSKNYRIERKQSGIACIEYIEEGCGTVHLDGESFSPSGGDSYFLQEGKDQYYFSDERTPWKKHFINLSGGLVKALAEGYGLTDVSYFEGLDLKEELLSILSLAKEERDDCTPELITILNKIFLKMHSHIKSKHGHDELETKMKDFLGTQITQPFSLARLCEHIGKSESQVIRLFKRAYGITPYAYVLKKKLSLAKNLLDGTALTVRQIADKLCFADEYYFSNIFKSKVGLSPLAYRNRSKE